MIIRRYEPRDGAACHALRREAFLGVFRDTLPEAAVRAGAESYDVAAFARRLGAMDTFVAEIDDAVAAFCSIRLETPAQAELLYLYVGSAHHGAGLGSRLSRLTEQHVARAHPDLESFFLVTAVPDYNQAFWERLGYRYAGTSVCDYPTGRIPAVRLEKAVVKPRRQPAD